MTSFHLDLISCYNSSQNSGKYLGSPVYYVIKDMIGIDEQSDEEIQSEICGKEHGYSMSFLGVPFSQHQNVFNSIKLSELCDLEIFIWRFHCIGTIDH